MADREILRHVSLPATTNPVRLVQEEIPVARGRFRVLVDRDDDRLDVVGSTNPSTPGIFSGRRTAWRTSVWWNQKQLPYCLATRPSSPSRMDSLIMRASGSGR